MEAWAQAVPGLLAYLDPALSGAPGHVTSIGPALARIGDGEMVGRMLEFTAAAPDLHFGFFGSLDHFRGTLALRLGKIERLAQDADETISAVLLDVRMASRGHRLHDTVYKLTPLRAGR